jgi:hypothetical protein
MARGPLTFRQQDLVRALKAAKAAGIEVARVEIDKSGRIIVVAGKPAETDGETRHPGLLCPVLPCAVWLVCNLVCKPIPQPCTYTSKANQLDKREERSLAKAAFG